MKYNLVNENFKSDYVRQLVESRGGDYDKLINIDKTSLNNPELLDNIEKAATLFISKITSDSPKKIIYIVD